jgi:hypothetical protein
MEPFSMAITACMFFGVEGEDVDVLPREVLEASEPP